MRTACRGDTNRAASAACSPTADALVAAFERFDADPTARVAVLRGQGGHFCAGADLKAFSNRFEPPTSGEGTPAAGSGGAPGPMGPTRMALSKPVIGEGGDKPHRSASASGCAGCCTTHPPAHRRPCCHPPAATITGFCVAGGLELALWADLRVAASDAVFGVFCRRWGVPLIDGGTVRLPRLIGMSRAMDMILTGRPVPADEALAMGLVNRLVPVAAPAPLASDAPTRSAASSSGSTSAAPDAVLAASLDLARQLASFPQECMRRDRAAAVEAWGLPVPAALQVEYHHGEVSMRHARAGAQRFAGGEGRHGAFARSGGVVASVPQLPRRQYCTSAAAAAGVARACRRVPRPLAVGVRLVCAALAWVGGQ